jgi:O-antigen/teichoic acid export membrane protein
MTDGGGASRRDRSAILPGLMSKTQAQDRNAAPASRGRAWFALQTYGSQIGVASLSLVNALVVARALGPDGRGQVAFLTAIAWLSSNAATLGIQEANVNIASTEPQLRRSLATNSLLLALVFGAVALIVIAILVAVVPAATGDADLTLFWGVLGCLPVLILSVYLRFLLQGDYKFGVTNLAWFLPAVTNVTGNGVLALLGALSVTSAVSTWLVGQLLGTLILARHLVAHSVGFGRPDLALARRTLAFGGKSHFGRIMLLANYRADQWILGAIAGSRQLGLYSVAVAWAEGLFMLPTALAAVQRPDVVRATEREAAEQTAIVFRVSVLLTAVMAGVLVALAPLLCAGVFGEEFRGSTDQLRILAAGAFGVVALKQIGSALTGRQRPTAASLSIGAAFACTIVLDFLLIPGHGAMGAAIASSVAYTFGGIVIGIVFARTLGVPITSLVPRPQDLRWIVSLGRRALRRRPPPAPVEVAEVAEEVTQGTAP